MTWWDLAWPWLSLFAYVAFLEWLLIVRLDSRSMTERFREALRRPSAWAWRVVYVAVGVVLTGHLFWGWW